MNVIRENTRLANNVKHINLDIIHTYFSCDYLCWR
jgi:hypothetical protein